MRLPTRFLRARRATPRRNPDDRLLELRRAVSLGDKTAELQLTAHLKRLGRGFPYEDYYGDPFDSPRGPEPGVRYAGPLALTRFLAAARWDRASKRLYCRTLLRSATARRTLLFSTSGCM